MTNETNLKIREIAEEVSKREGCRLYDVEFVGAGRHRILRVYIDSADGTAVSVDQCANVSHGMSLLLDVQDLVAGGKYELEVSSPGLERFLREPWHFQTALGKTVKFVTTEGLTGPRGEIRSGVGELLEAGEELVFMLNGQKINVPYRVIKRANVVYDYKQK